MIEEAGFTQVEATDLTPTFITILTNELKYFKPQYQSFIKVNNNALSLVWENKMVREFAKHVQKWVNENIIFIYFNNLLPIQDYSERDYQEIVEGWETKLVRCRSGDQVWGMFKARK